MLPALDEHPHRPRVAPRQGRRAHPRDQPARRSQPARRHRHQGPGREHHRARLRRAPGRRRHPHRRHHRRLGGARGCRRPTPAPRVSSPPGAEPLTGSIAAVSVGLVDGRPVLDLDYPEDSTAQTDMNVVMTGDGRFVEVQGTAEGAGAAFDRDGARRPARPRDRPAAPSSPASSRRRSPRPCGSGSRDPPARARDPQRAQGARAAPDPRGAGRRARAGGRRCRRRRGRTRRRRDGGDLPRQRPAQGRRARRRPPGCRRSPTTPGSRSTCSAARPGCSPPAGQGRRPGRMPVAGERDRANLDLLLEQIGDVPDEHRAAAFVCAAVVALPDGRVEGVEGRVHRAPSCGNRAARTGSATTRSSCRTATPAPSPSTPTSRRTRSRTGATPSAPSSRCFATCSA